jgi:ABC-type transport system substrate-binding protein
MYCNDDFQTNLEKMITAKTPTELEELSKIGQQKVMEDAPWIVLFQPDWVLATRKGVTGLSFYNDLHMHFASLTKSN